MDDDSLDRKKEIDDIWDMKLAKKGIIQVCFVSLSLKRTAFR